MSAPRMWSRTACAIALASLSCAAMAMSVASKPVASASTTRAVEMTFLKASPGRRDALVAFIERNWFAMDATAHAEGLICSYRMHAGGDDAATWDVVVSVTYADAAGYDGIRGAFERIRAAHATVPAGTRLADVGRIVESRALLDTGDAACDGAG